MPRDEEGTRVKGWILGNQIRLCLEHKKFAIMMNDTVSKFKLNHYMMIKPYLGFEL